MSDDTQTDDTQADEETFHEKYQREQKEKEDLLVSNGFDKHVVRMGGSGFGFGDILGVFADGPTEAGICLTCYALVPIVDLKGGSTAIEAHRARDESLETK